MIRAAASRRRQRGLTLIEMMVSIALGLLILAAILQLFTASRQTYRLQQNVARMQENARIAVEVLQRSVRDAGFEPPPASTAVLTCASADNCLLGGQNDLTSSQATSRGARQGSDTLTVRFRSDGNMSDCIGVGQNTSVSGYLQTPNTRATGIYYIDATDINLSCDNTDPGPGGTTHSGPQPLIDDIDDMQVLFGYRDSSTGNLVYVPGSVLSTAQYYLVTAVRIQLCVRSPDSNVVTAANTQH